MTWLVNVPFTRVREKPALNWKGDSNCLNSIEASECRYSFVRIHEEMTGIKVILGQAIWSWDVSYKCTVSSGVDKIGLAGLVFSYVALSSHAGISCASVSGIAESVYSRVPDFITPDSDNIGTPFFKRIKTACISDSPTKDYKRRKNNGEIINTPVSNRKVDMEVQYDSYATPPKLAVSRGNFVYGVLTVYVAAYQSKCCPPTEDLCLAEFAAIKDQSVVSTTNYIDIAVNNAFGNINSGAYNYFEEVGEFKETFEFITKKFSYIASLIKAARKGQFFKVAPKTWKKFTRKAKLAARRNGTSLSYERSNMMIDIASSAWLELRFAIRPLIYSVEDAIKLHNEGLKKQNPRLTSNHAIGGSGTSLDITETTSNGVKTVTSIDISSHRLAVGGVLFQTITNQNTMRRLGFTNFAGTLWELTFLSWAADYFVDLSGFFYHFTPNVGVRPLTAWASWKDDITVTKTIHRYDIADNMLIDTVKFITTINSYNRRPVIGPGFFNVNIDIDINKVLDLATLFRVMSRRGSTNQLHL
jgi:hypothetical protein